MEFKLNKIELDVRQQINAETKEGKVHTKKGIHINKDKGEDRNKGNNRHREKEEKEKFDLAKYAGGKKIMIEAVKTKEIEIKAVNDEHQYGTKYLRGLFIDIRK